MNSQRVFINVLVVIVVLAVVSVSGYYFVSQNKNKPIIPDAVKAVGALSGTPQSTQPQDGNINPPSQKSPEKIAAIIYDGPIHAGSVTVDSYRVMRKFYETHPDIYDLIVI